MFNTAGLEHEIGNVGAMNLFDCDQHLGIGRVNMVAVAFDPRPDEGEQVIEHGSGFRGHKKAEARHRIERRQPVGNPIETIDSVP
jgi:hypothetical protein